MNSQSLKSPNTALPSVNNHLRLTREASSTSQIFQTNLAKSGGIGVPGNQTYDDISSNQEPAFGLYEKVIEMERWFHEERKNMSEILNTNTPLVIVWPEGSGRTTLLFQWIEFHEAKSEFFTNIFDKNTYFLHFVNNLNIKNSHYTMMYRLTNKLRTIFDLNQRIEMSNDKLRTFFSRWLELADSKKKNLTTDKCKIIMVIDGIDRFESEESQSQSYEDKKKKNPSTATTSFNVTDSLSASGSAEIKNSHNQGQIEEESTDWLPESFPNSFRVILTCRPGSKALRQFQSMRVPFRFLYMNEPTSKSIHQIIDSHFSTSSCYSSVEELQTKKQEALQYIAENEKLFNNMLYLHSFLNIMYPQSINLKRFSIEPIVLQQVNNLGMIEKFQNTYNSGGGNNNNNNNNNSYQWSVTELLFIHALKHYESKLLTKSKFKKLCCIMAVTKSGIKKEELKDCVEVKIETIDIFIRIFGFALVEHRQLFRINNDAFRRTIQQLYMVEDQYKNEIHQSIVAVLSKTKHFSSNARLIDEITYNIYKQNNQWLKLKDLLSSLEVFCHMYKPQDKYTLAQYWQKLEQHGFDPVYEYNKTMEAFVLNYFPTQSELFVILTQFSRFFKEFGDLETRSTPEFRHPPLISSAELEKIRLKFELEQVGDMLIEVKGNSNVSPISEEEKFNIDNPLFMQVYRKKQLAQLSKENPLFQACLYYYYKRWVWLQFPWFCMDINSDFSHYMNKTMGGIKIHLHMDNKSELNLVVGSIRIIKEARSRKQQSGKHQIYTVPLEFAMDQQRSDSQKSEESAEYSDEESLVTRRESIRSTMLYQSATSPRNISKNQGGHSPGHRQQSNNLNSLFGSQLGQDSIQSPSQMIGSAFERPYTTSVEGRKQGRATFINMNMRQVGTSQMAHRLHTGSLTQRSAVEFNSDRKSQYQLAKNKWIDQDFELSNLKSKILPENAVRIVGNKVKNYERKELETIVQLNREMVNEYNKIAFEIQQKTRILATLSNCVVELDHNTKESLAFEKLVHNVTEKLNTTRSNYKVARKEQNRLKHIVSYCFKNKADNHEWIQGLEIAVKNMFIMIKHEKDSILTSKNLVQDLKKESKQMTSLKLERIQLQQTIKNSMYSMMKEKQNIKNMREDFDRRQRSIMSGMSVNSQYNNNNGNGGQVRSSSVTKKVGFSGAGRDDLEDISQYTAIMEGGNNKQQRRVQTSQLSLTNGGGGPRGTNFLSVMTAAAGSRTMRVQKTAQSGRSSPAFSPSKRGSKQEEGRAAIGFGNSGIKNLIQLQLYDPAQSSTANLDDTSQLVVKLEKMRMLAGAKSIEDVQQMVEFIGNYRDMVQLKESSELRLRALRMKKQQVLEEVKQFHDQDIDKSNKRYVPHVLQNNIKEDIVQKQLDQNIKLQMLRKGQELLISTKILLQEMKKKAQHLGNASTKPLLRLSSSKSTIYNQQMKEQQQRGQTIAQENPLVTLHEVSQNVESKILWLEKLFGTSDFHEVMVKVNEMDPLYLKSMIQSIKPVEKISITFAARQISADLEGVAFSPIVDQNNGNQEPMFFNQLLGNDINMNVEKKQKSVTINDEKGDNLGENIISVIDYSVTPQSQNSDNNNDNNKLSQEQKKKLKQQHKKDIFMKGKQYLSADKAPIRGDSGKKQSMSQLHNGPPLVPSTTMRSKKESQQLILMQQKSCPNPQNQEYLMNDPYIQSLLTLSKPLAEKEQIFFQVVEEQQKQEEIVRMTVKSIVEFKKQTSEQKQDESFLFLEDERKKQKHRFNLLQQASSPELNQDMPQQNQEIQAQPNIKQRSVSFQKGFEQARPKQVQQKKSQLMVAQDENPPGDEASFQDQQRQSPSKLQHQSNTMVVQKSSSNFLTRTETSAMETTTKNGAKSSRQQHRRLGSLPAAFSINELDKLPTYAQSILSSGHKEILKQYMKMNSNISKLDREALINKLVKSASTKQYDSSQKADTSIRDRNNNKDIL